LGEAMIELKQNNIWSDSLNSFLNFDEPWDYIDKELHKFICFAGAGGGPGGGDGGSAADFENAMATAPTDFGTPADDTGITSPEDFGTPADDMGIVDDTVPDDPLAGLDPGEFGDPTIGFEADPFGGKSTRGPGDLGLGDREFLGFTFNRFNELVDRSFPELIADVVDVINPFAGFLGRELIGLVDKENTLGLNRSNPVEQVANVIGTFSRDAQTSLDTLGQGINAAKSEAIDAVTSSIGLGPSNTGPSVSTSGVSNTGTDTGFGEPDGLDRLTGLASVVQQNPLEVRPQNEVQSSASGTSRITRRPFNFTPGRIFAQTGGGIQDLINKEPTLLDVVNKGMAMPEETIPTQRPQQFISGQQQPGGLRSTNYYTNAMQPASFYAQPQQVRNYGSIY
jgi:hypothetical protein